VRRRINYFTQRICLIFSIDRIPTQLNKLDKLNKPNNLNNRKRCKKLSQPNQLNQLSSRFIDPRQLPGGPFLFRHIDQARDHDSLGLGGTGAVHGFGQIADRRGSQGHVFD